MKIDDSIKKTGSLAVTPTQTRSGKAVSKSSSGSVSAGDNVRLSSQAQSLDAGGSSVFDANKVEEIKAAIAGGQFQVNPEKVASGLINNVSDLLRTQSAQ